MKTFTYIVFVELNSASGGLCTNEIATKVNIELSDEVANQLEDFLQNYNSEKWRVAKALHKSAQHIHSRLMKGAFEHVRYILTLNAVDSGFSEFTEWDLFDEDCNNGNFDFDAKLSEEDNFAHWKVLEDEKIHNMNICEIADYYCERYGIELDFDECDYSYRFSEQGRKNCFTVWY